MAFKEYDQFDALGLATLVKEGEVSAKELLDEAISRADRLNPTINAINTSLYDHGYQQIEKGLPEGPFSGVPFLLKDLGSSLAGMPKSDGSEALKGFVSEKSSELVNRFLSSGVVIFGKTNTPELGLMGVTEPKAFGATRNPWNIEHTPGGSSGGSGAAVAARIVPMASAGDGGGSIRIPAACCGIFGLKPSRGRNPLGPDYDELWGGAVQEHVLSLSVRDSAAMLDVTSGVDVGDPYWQACPGESFEDAIKQEPKKLRIAYSFLSPFGNEIDPEAIAALKHTVSILEGLGHNVIEADPQIDGQQIMTAYLATYYGHVAADLREMAKRLGTTVRRLKVEEATKIIGLVGESMSAGEFTEIRRGWNQMARKMGEFHQQYDLFLTPTIATPPIKVNELSPGILEQAGMTLVNRLGFGGMAKASGLIDANAKDNLQKMPFTQLFNLTGQPAMSVPLYWTKKGLPLGSQFVAANGNEALLLQLAAQLELAQPWFDKRPAMV